MSQRLRTPRSAATVLPPCWPPRFSFDADYVRRLIAEDPDTERHFTQYFSDVLSAKLRSRLRSPELAEDAQQETFVRVLTTLKKKGSLVTAGSLGAFVNAVCNNVLLEIYRSTGQMRALDTDTGELAALEPSIESQVLKREARGQVRDAIAGLPRKDKILIRRLFFEDRSKDEVCRELQVDREYLRVLIHRAKQRLRERFVVQEERVRHSRRCSVNRGNRFDGPLCPWVTDRDECGN